ncbi:hypothetical protein KM043_017738 [Ampulex compressa]|nr:hypothetical protein KM043_017738 [Ampulex compressa]
MFSNFQTNSPLPLVKFLHAEEGGRALQRPNVTDKNSNSESWRGWSYPPRLNEGGWSLDSDQNEARGACRSFEPSALPVLGCSSAREVLPWAFLLGFHAFLDPVSLSLKVSRALVRGVVVLQAVGFGVSETLTMATLCPASKAILRSYRTHEASKRGL